MALRTFTLEFKISAVQLVNHQGYTVAAAATDRRVPEPPHSDSPFGKTRMGQQIPSARRPCLERQ